MEKLENVIFYSLEKTIRSYRQFAQRQLKKGNCLITIDQWMVLTLIQENPGIKQSEIGELIFKDKASIARMIDLLVRKKYLERNSHSADRRRTTLKITKAGRKVIEEAKKIVVKYRAQALHRVTKPDIKMLKQTLDKITANCH